MSEFGETPRDVVAQAAPDDKRIEKGVRKTIEVNGQQWQYLEHGSPSGIPILNIHGWLGSSAEGNENLSEALAGQQKDSLGMKNLQGEKPESAQTLRERVKTLEGKYRIITPELPGFGFTPELPGKVTLDKLADSLVDFYKAVGVEKPIVFGASMGGIIGIKMAARHPDALQALVVQGTMTQPKDISKVIYLAEKIATWPPLAFLLEKSGLSPKLFEMIVSGSKDFKMADPQTQAKIIEPIHKAHEKTASSTLSELGDDILEDMKKTVCPVLVIDGANGDLVPIRNSNRNVAERFYDNKTIGEKVPDNVVFIPISGFGGLHGHNLINTFPEAVASWIDYVNSKWAAKSNKTTSNPTS